MPQEPLKTLQTPHDSEPLVHHQSPGPSVTSHQISDPKFAGEASPRQQPANSNSNGSTSTSTPTPATNNNNGNHSNNSKQQQLDAKKESSTLPTNTKGLHTVFIHKLYSMLEDDQLKHLIWWSASNESFLITPGEEFSKALAQYFKHTNVASFIRQLNMYGFHKVSDGSNQGSNDGDVPTWEFRHSSGSFRKGDVDSLKSIKRRSSKHTSRNAGNTTTTLGNAYYDSESEYNSERNNSYTDLSSLNDANGGNVDPTMNVRLAELGHNLASIRHEHARLQLRYDTAIEDVRKINMDMVLLLDIVQKLIQTPQVSGNGVVTSPRLKRSEDELASPGTAPRYQQGQPQSQFQQVKYSLQDVEQDIARFRSTILQRATSKDFDQYSSVSFAPSYQVNQQISRSSYIAPQRSQTPTQPHPPTPAPSQLQPLQHQQPQQQPFAQSQPPVPTSGPSSPSNPSAPVPYPYPYPPPPQQSHIQHYPYQQPHVHHQIVQNPFDNDRKSSTSSSSKGRHMSILYDPLSTGPASNNISPAASIHRGSHSGPTSNPDTYPPQSSTNGGYFPDYAPHRRQSPDAHHKQTFPPPHPAAQLTREQRPSSFPGLIPSVQHLRPEFQRKRHSSNDAMMDNYNNPPRSVPDQSQAQSQSQAQAQGQAQPAQPPQGQQPLSPAPPELKSLGSSTGVHALLNPVGVPPAKKAKK